MKIKSQGFLLAEAVFSVFVTLIVVLILQGLLRNLKLVDEAKNEADEIAYNYVQFNNFLHGDKNKKFYIDLERSDFQRIAINQYREGEKDVQKRYILQRYKSMIRVTTDKGGHMPLILDVKKSKFCVEDKTLKIVVTEKDNRTSELFFKLDSKPEKEDRDDKKKKHFT